jgi:hypothetical protein
MSHPGAAGPPDTSSAIIVKADEVDEAGADISTISLADSSPADFEERIESRRAQDTQAKGGPKILANAVTSSPKPLSRPVLRRDASESLTPLHPPPLTPERDEPGNPTDSLSLMQLKRLVTDLPKLERTAYAYEYEDTRSLPEELEEWFQYTEEERYVLLRSKLTFEEKWEETRATSIESGNLLGWRDAGAAARKEFTVHALRGLASHDISVRVKSLECLSYIALGVWGETAGRDEVHSEFNTHDGGMKPLDVEYGKSTVQIEWIFGGAKLLCETSAIPGLIDILRRYCEDESVLQWLRRECSSSFNTHDVADANA